MFDTYFTLEEAVALLPTVQEALTLAREALDQLRDELILLKRVAIIKEKTGRDLLPDEDDAFEQKRLVYEATYKCWVERFINRGVMLRDLERGLVDFPYKTKQGDEYMLCWHDGEDGIFYFHEPSGGYSGRKPISLLPN
jgi:hypothetical protein